MKLAIATTPKRKANKWTRKKQHGRPFSAREKKVAEMDECMLFLLVDRGVYNAKWVRKVRARAGRPVPHFRMKWEGERD